MVSVFLVNRVDVWVVYQRWYLELGTWVGVWEKSSQERGRMKGNTTTVDAGFLSCCQVWLESSPV